jgi:outer membrane protein assembly factor BamE (lipoprotein component of BamABCDE complex)
MVNASDRATGPVTGPATGPGSSKGRALAVASALLLLGGCGASSFLPSYASLPALPGADLFESPSQVRGHMIEEEDLRQIVVGVSSRSDVETLLGSPSATGTFDENDWFYIGGVTRQRPGRNLALEDQRVVRIRFDQRGRVQEIARLGPQDGRDVAVVQRETPSPGTERTLLQQLFGNVGRLGPGLGQTGNTGGPGAPSPTTSTR